MIVSMAQINVSSIIVLTLQALFGPLHLQKKNPKMIILSIEADSLASLNST